LLETSSRSLEFLFRHCEIFLLSGIGKALAKEFAIRNARVILACRSLPKAEIARKDIMDHSAGKHAQVKIMFLDLSSLDSVRQFSKEIASNEKRYAIRN